MRLADDVGELLLAELSGADHIQSDRDGVTGVAIFLDQRDGRIDHDLAQREPLAAGDDSDRSGEAGGVPGREELFGVRSGVAVLHRRWAPELDIEVAIGRFRPPIATTVDANNSGMDNSSHDALQFVDVNPAGIRRAGVILR